MTSCCRAAPAEEMFRPATARRSLKRYRAKGLDSLERRMVASAIRHGVRGARVLEIGGGIGALQSELLEAGAQSGEIAELVSSYEPYAQELARDKGLEERVTYRVENILDDARHVEVADVVFLNRVVCCSPDGVELARRAAALARATLVLSFPRDVAWVRTAIGLLNVGQWLRGRMFRAFVHSPALLRAVAEEQGMLVADEGRTAFWAFTTLRRAT